MALHAHRLKVALLLLLLNALGCATGRAPATSPASDEIGLEIRWVRDSIEFGALCRQVYAEATREVERLAADREPGRWAVVLDADETLLSNVGYQIWLAETGQSYDESNWAEWTHRRAAVAIPGVRAFLERVHEIGGRIAVVTNRRQEICDVTEQNLQSEQLPYDLILCRDAERAKDGRWQRIADGTAAEGIAPLEILAWFGDNIYDFPGWTQERKVEPDAAFAEFGRRFFLLPNPLYGSWE